MQYRREVEAIAREAFRAIALCCKGFEIAHLQFRAGRDLVAVSSRIRSYGEIEIEIDVGNPNLPAVVFSEAELREFNRHTGSQPRGPSKQSTGSIFHLSR